MPPTYDELRMVWWERLHYLFPMGYQNALLEWHRLLREHEPEAANIPHWMFRRVRKQVAQMKDDQELQAFAQSPPSMKEAFALLYAMSEAQSVLLHDYDPMRIESLALLQEIGERPDAVRLAMLGLDHWLGRRRR